MIKLAVFDIAGTIVSDDGVVIDCFSAAFKEVVPEIWADREREFLDYARETMGQSKIQVFEELLQSPELAAQAASAFQRNYLSRLADVKLFNGVILMFDSLRARGVKIALNTGFNRETLDTMLSELGLGDSVDATATQSEAGEGRPSPAMIALVAQQLGISSPAEVAVIGDTKSDMEAAENFGAGLKIAVLTGEHDRDELLAAGADHVIDHVVQVEQLLI
jgi:phosphonatase-like hydrolase